MKPDPYHPNEELLCAYAEGALDPKQKEQVELHLAQCEACLETVAGLLRGARTIEGAELLETPGDLEEAVKGWVTETGAKEPITTSTLVERLKGLLLDVFPRYAFTYKFATAALAALVVAFLSYTILTRVAPPERTAVSTVRGFAPVPSGDLLEPKGDVPVADELMFKWNTRVDADFYEIAVMDFESGESILRDSSILPELSVETEAHDLKPGTTYYWMVLYHMKDGRVLESAPQNFSLTE
jgi:hypothetical protein